MISKCCLFFYSKVNIEWIRYNLCLNKYFNNFVREYNNSLSSCQIWECIIVLFSNKTLILQNNCKQIQRYHNKSSHARHWSCSNLLEGYKTDRAACKRIDIFQQNCVFGIDAPAVFKDNDNDDEPFPQDYREQSWYFVYLNILMSTK